MDSPIDAALVARLAEFDTAVEVGIGARTAVAAALCDQGVTMTATDVVSRDVPDGVAFVIDDAFDPDLDIYRDAAVIYALNSPPELHRSIRAIARAVDARFLFTTLGGDFPVVPVSTETIPGGTLYRTADAIARRDRTGPGDSDDPEEGDDPDDHLDLNERERSRHAR